MDLKAELLVNSDPLWTERLTRYVCNQKQRHHLIMNIFFSTDYRLAQRATLIILSCQKRHPQWLRDQVPRLVKSLKASLPVAQKRNILRVLQNQEIPENLWGHAVDQCFSYLLSASEPIAVKVFSMTILYNLAVKIPELGRELRLTIEEQYPMGSAGFKARGRKVLQELKKKGH